MTDWPPLKDEPEPGDKLVDWAHQNAGHLLLTDPWNRAWWNSLPPPGEWDVWERPCCCKPKNRLTPMVKMGRKTLADNDGSIWIGQCDVCQAIVWSVKL